MNLIKLNEPFNTYPYSVEDFRRHNPSFTFPEDLSGVDLSIFEVAIVEPTAPPTYDSATEVLEEQEPELIDGMWHQRWSVRAKLPEEYSPDWDGFNAQLITDPAYHQAVTNVRASALPGLDTPVVVALGQVATNGVASFALSFPPFCQYGQISTEQREVWATLAESFHLPTDFCEVIRG